MRLLPVLALAFLCPVVALAGDWQALSNDDISAALTDRTLEYTGAKQVLGLS